MPGEEPEPLVGLDRVDALVLERVGADLVHQPDAPPLLVEIEQHAAALLDDLLHGRVQLPAAVAPRGMKQVAGQTRGVHAGEHVLPVANLSADEGDVRLSGKGVLEHTDVELAVVGWELCRGDATDPWHPEEGVQKRQRAANPGTHMEYLMRSEVVCNRRWGRTHCQSARSTP